MGQHLIYFFLVLHVKVFLSFVWERVWLLVDFGSEDFGVYEDQMSELSLGLGDGGSREARLRNGVRDCSQLP